MGILMVIVVLMCNFEVSMTDIVSLIVALGTRRDAVDGSLRLRGPPWKWLWVHCLNSHSAYIGVKLYGHLSSRCRRDDVSVGMGRCWCWEHCGNHGCASQTDGRYDYGGEAEIGLLHRVETGTLGRSRRYGTTGEDDGPVTG